MSYTPNPTWVDNVSDITAAKMQKYDDTLASLPAVAFSGSYTDLSNKPTIPSGSAVVHNTQTGTAYTVALTDAGDVVEMNNASANTLTVPTNASVAFPVGTYFYVRQIGAGQTTIAAAGGVTLRSRLGSGTILLAGQWSECTLTLRATNEWVVSGEVTL